MNEKKVIYLSGPIMDEHEGHAREWRDKATRELEKHFLLLDPMRRNFKDREVDSANEIVEFDLQDVRDADILLVNYNKPSIGTSMEVFHASFNLGKFIIGFSPFSFKDCSPWMVRFCTKILPSLEEAIAYIKENFVKLDHAEPSRKSRSTSSARK
jgi:nucleoside 2-deoxyribosyltransferase